MPRLAKSLLYGARRLHPLLVPLLRTCRDLPSARNELRWIKEHVSKLVTAKEQSGAHGNAGSIITAQARQALLKKLCYDRGRGKPLQYILGTAWFGDLELRCEPGVLIPRPETAAITTYLAQRLLHNRDGLPDGQHWDSSKDPIIRTLDLCSGTGCMSLLLCHLLHEHMAVRALGIDVSERAVQLARKNLIATDLCAYDIWDPEIQYLRADILDESFHPSHVPGRLSSKYVRNLVEDADASHMGGGSLGYSPRVDGPDNFDIVVANPPYISPDGYRNGTTTQSVRAFEPVRALVPPSSDGLMDGHAQADLFYPRILKIAADVKAKIVLLEAGDEAQAQRVLKLVLESGMWAGAEIWHDGVEAAMWAGDVAEETRTVDVAGRKIDVTVHGRVTKHETKPRKGRAIMCWTAEGARWVHRTEEKKI